MNIKLLKIQSGFALLIFLVILMGVGGLALTGFSQQALKGVQDKRFEHNKRVLEEAKQALLLYAYRYPDFNDQGPGRLPCPYDQINGYSVPPLTLPSICDAVGRFPRLSANLNFERETKDASGEYLWYAVSEEFRNVDSNDLGANFNGDDIVNSDSLGTITIFDQTGNILYDGATNGVAAVIIAPGAPLAGQDRNADPLDPANYLDTFGAYINSVFVNGDNDPDDGFRLGPYTHNNTLVINDQMIFITTAELVEMAEKATLEAYRDAVNVYRENTAQCLGEIPDGETTEAGCLSATTPGTWTRYYPWLDSFATTDLLNFDAEIGNGRGRVPAIFGQLFNVVATNDHNSTTQFRFEPVLSGVPDTNPVIEYLPAQDYADIFFDGSGDLVTSIDSSVTSKTVYFWDGHPTDTPTLARDGVYEICPGNDASSEDDCNMDTSGNFIIASDSDVWLQVIRLTITLDSGAVNGGRFTLTESSNSPKGITQSLPPDATSHAIAFGTYDNSSTDWNVNWDYDLNFKSAFDTSDPFPISQSGSLTTIKAGLTYYPELPDWARLNGWHHVLQMVVDDDYYPSGNNIDCTATGSCLTVLNSPVPNDGFISLLVLANSSTDMVDDGASGFTDDIEPLFAAENDFSNFVYDRRAGNDQVMVLQ